MTSSCFPIAKSAISSTTSKKSSRVTRICQSSRFTEIHLRPSSLQIHAVSIRSLQIHSPAPSSALFLLIFVFHLHCSPTPHAMRLTTTSTALIRKTARSKTKHKHQTNVRKPTRTARMLTRMIPIRQLTLERLRTIAMGLRKRSVGIHHKNHRSRTPRHRHGTSVSQSLRECWDHRSSGTQVRTLMAPQSRRRLVKWNIKGPATLKWSRCLTRRQIE